MTTSAWALDLDGVIWRGADTVPGAPEAVARLRDRGERIVFVTNSSARTPKQVAEKLASHGIPDAEDLVITSAMAAAALVEPGERVLALGSDGVIEALTERGADLVGNGIDDGVHDGDGAIATVVVGIRSDFDYPMLTTGMRAIHAGARLIATNDDPTFPDAAGLLPGNGALVAAFATAGGVAPTIAGKPHAPIVGMVLDHLGTRGIVVGDRPDTDGELATALGYRFGLVLSGVVGSADLPVEPTPDVVAADLAALVEAVIESPTAENPVC